MSLRREVIFIYDYFYPDFTAGGPVTSLGTLGELLSETCNISVITSGFSFANKQIIKGVELDSWTTWRTLRVWYATNSKSILDALSSFDSSKATTVYLNGVFSFRFFLKPLLFLNRRKNNDLIVCPRGMLQSGALKKSRLRKELYFLLLKWRGVLRNIQWHATDAQEAKDIRARFGINSTITTILNVPRLPLSHAAISKKEGELKLFYYSLITEKKNLLFFLDLMNAKGLENVHLYIGGPIKDAAYWQKCEKLIARPGMRERVFYLGELTPDRKENTISDFHALVLPTHGENFGHAIVEALSVSRPVLISDQTPWNDVSLSGAGYAIPLDADKWIATVKRMLLWDDKIFAGACAAASNYYQATFDFEKLKIDYLKLFENGSPS